MASMPSTQSARMARLLSVLAGCALIAMAFLIGLVLAEDTTVQRLQVALIVFGGLFIGLAFASRHHWFNSMLAKLSLAILTTALCLAGAEGIFRLSHFDFNRLGAPGEQLPIYYRPPSVHAGEGIFRRPGPATWRGKPLSAFMRLRWGITNAYLDEAPVEIHYDDLGFRNPAGLSDWEVVVTGDSFVELGYLADDEIFTAIAARRLGRRIKNLGISATGPISQTFYVKRYGKSPSTRDAVICFFEGNDVEDLSRELRQAEHFRTTGRPWREPAQSSLLIALQEQLRPRAQPSASAAATPNALLTNSANRPMTVFGPPPSWNRLSANRRENVQRALTNWADTVRAQGMRPWLIYMPDSQRVFHGLFRFTTTNVVNAWTPDDFAGPLGQVCTNLGIGFINPWPALRRAAEEGAVPYNLIGDTHLSREGSKIVGEVLADALQSK